MSIVRDALLTSVACTAPPVSFHTSHASTVPARAVPALAASRTAALFSSSQRSLVPLKYVAIGRPVFARKRSLPSPSPPSSISRAHTPLVRVSIHTSALCSGSPVSASHTTVVSRWFVMPTAATARPATAASASTEATTRRTVAQISFGSCSTHPCCGMICANSSCATATTLLCASKRIARLDVVPASMASTSLSAAMLDLVACAWWWIDTGGRH